MTSVGSDWPVPKPYLLLNIFILLRNMQVYIKLVSEGNQMKKKKLVLRKTIVIVPHV